jgi:hypothetical protein
MAFAALALNTKDDGNWIMYAAVSTLLLPFAGLMAIALIVSDPGTEICPEYRVDAAVGVVPLMAY